jgi:hypothetical protein
MTTTISSEQLATVAGGVDLRQAHRAGAATTLQGALIGGWTGIAAGATAGAAFGALGGPPGTVAGGIGGATVGELIGMQTFSDEKTIEVDKD